MTLSNQTLNKSRNNNIATFYYSLVEIVCVSEYLVRDFSLLKLSLRILLTRKVPVQGRPVQGLTVYGVHLTGRVSLFLNNVLLICLCVCFNNVLTTSLERGLCKTRPKCKHSHVTDRKGELYCYYIQ